MAAAPPVSPVPTFPRSHVPTLPAVLCLCACLALAGCPGAPTDDGPGHKNTTDPTNGGASYVGSTACQTCHADVAATYASHAHNWTLNPVQGEPPEFPAAATNAGVPNPPEGFDWTDISYVIGGYRNGARFINRDGFVLTNGANGVDVQWDVVVPASGIRAGFVPFEPDATANEPLDFDALAAMSTGAMRSGVRMPQFQDSRPGLMGTWSEPGVRCEACHGPGSAHFGIERGVVRIHRERIFVDLTGAQTCNGCHARPFGAPDGVIRASGGYIDGQQQYAELAASGGHAREHITCAMCHEPHDSVTYDRAAAIRNDCTVCHTDQNMARHAGKTYVAANGYRETLRCESCHMPPATRTRSSTLVESFDLDGRSRGSFGRVGDTRTHIFRIQSEARDYTRMLNAQGDAVRVDAQGRAAVTVDFICLRCHNGQGNVFGLTFDFVADVAGQMHTEFGPQALEQLALIRAAIRAK